MEAGRSSYFFIRDMTMEDAQYIASWTYEEPYGMYSMDGSEDVIRSLLEETYYVVENDFDSVFGYFCLGREATVPGGYDAGIYDDTDNVADLGLGMHPDWTGKGLSSPFISAILQWIRHTLQVNRVRLVVAVFNERAIRAYEKSGFIRGDLFFTKAGGADIPFVVMTKNLIEEEHT